MRLSELVRRVLAAAALLAVGAWLLPAWLALDGLPRWAVAAWFLVAAAAAMAPGPSLLALVAGAPLVPILPERLGWPPVALIEMWLVALLVPAWVRVVIGRDPAVLPRTAALLLAVVTASLVVSMAGFVVPLGGVRELAAALHGFLREDYVTLVGARHVYASVSAWAVAAEGVGLGWLFWRWLRHRPAHARPGRRLAAAALAGAALVSAWGVRQWWTREDLLPFWLVADPHITRINATFTDVNTLGSYLSGALVVTVGSLVAARTRRGRRAALLAALVIAPALVFTGSRVAWAAAGIGLGVYLLSATWAGAWRVLAEPERVRLRRRAGLAGAAIVALLLAAGAYGTLADVRHEHQRSYLDTLLHTLNLREPLEQKFKGRLALWEAGWRMVQQRPWTGIGIGRFYKDVSRYATDPDALVRPQEHAHNYFLQLAAELGLPALGLWLSMIGALAFGVTVGMSGRRRQPADPGALHLTAAGRGAVVAFLVTCLTGHPLVLREGQVAFWTWLALAASGGPVALGGRPPWVHRAFVSALVLVVVTTPWRVAAELGRVDRWRFPVGLHEPETMPDGSVFRWSGRQATLFVPASAAAVHLSVRTLAPMPQTLEVHLDGRLIDVLVLDDHAWRRLRYVLPRQVPAGDYRELQLSVTPTWRPADDGRELGVMLRDAGWSP